MANQKRAAGANLWFVTAEGTGKIRNLEANPHVNLSYYKDRTREWISVSGLATLSRSTEDPRAVCSDWKFSFPDKGDPRTVFPTTRGSFIGVDIHAAVFLEVNKRSPSCCSRLRKDG